MARRLIDDVAFAHSGKLLAEAEWEPLPVHLDEVGLLSGERADKFGFGFLGEIEGRLHDFGKFKDTFQRYLRDPKVTGKGHSMAGAVYARRHFGHVFGAILAHVIAGHHSGLGDGLLAKDGRLDQAAQELDHALAGFRARPSGFTLPPDEDGEFEAGGFETAFLIRMMFSCLVDADRICTERYYARLEKREVERGPGATIAELLAVFGPWMAAQEREREANGASEREVNLRRRDVLHSVRSHAEDVRGTFTLTVPTGGGKTLSGMDFALRHAAHHGLDRVIVVIPFTSVIEQNAEVYRTALGPHAGELLEHHSAFDEDDLKGERWQGRTKLQLDMENWDARIVVTTAVQFFESLFSNRPSRCRKLHNIANSVIILDEAQTMPLRLLRPCVAALRELVAAYGCSVVLSTATQPALLDSGRENPSFEGGFPAGSVTQLAPDLVGLFEQMKRVTVVDFGVQTDEQLAARLDEAGRGLCIVNTRRHARELFGRLAGDGVFHLSTMMHAEHRSRVLAEIRARLKDERPCRVVSTSMIEAGVDVDFPFVMRAVTGLDRLAQSAGRLNREGKRQPGDSVLGVFRPAKVEGQLRVPPDLEPFVSAAVEAMRRAGDDPFAPEPMKRYFESIYWRVGLETLDEPGVLKQCAAAEGDHDYPFETIAKGFRLIDSETKPVIVANDDESEQWLAELENPFSKQPLRTITRKLQRYTVGVPERDRGRLLAAGAAAVIRQDMFGDQFVALRHLHVYRPDVGLDASDPCFMEASDLVV